MVSGTRDNALVSAVALAVNAPRGLMRCQTSVSIEYTSPGPCLSVARDTFASLAAFERDLIRERSEAGLSAARARGRKGGRPKGVDQKKQKAALALKQDPRHSVREMREIVSISRNIS